MEIKLNEKEINIVKICQNAIENEKASLISLRYQYLVAEKKLIETMDKAEADYIDNLKTIVKNKIIINDIIFDPDILASIITFPKNPGSCIEISIGKVENLITKNADMLKNDWIINKYKMFEQFEQNK